MQANNFLQRQNLYDENIISKLEKTGDTQWVSTFDTQPVTK